MKNTLIVFVADHGTMMGEQGQLHKGETRLRVQCTNVPLAVYHPTLNWAGRKLRGYVQHHDLMPTVLERLGDHERDVRRGGDVMPDLNCPWFLEAGAPTDNGALTSDPGVRRGVPASSLHRSTLP